jgi:Tol biopolymer transport system component
MQTNQALRFFVDTTVAVLFIAGLPSMAATQIASQLAPSARVSTVGGSDAYDPIVTPNGQYALFASTSDNLVVGSGGKAMPEAVPAHMNVFLRNRQTGATVLVSVNAAGTAGGNGDSYPCAISSNGQFAVFQSSASNLVPGDTNSAGDVYVRDTVNNITTLVSVGTNGAPGNGASGDAVITPDGRYVAFDSAASNLVVLDTNGIQDVFVRDLKLGTTTLASVGANVYANIVTTTLTIGSASLVPIISADGRYVAFFSSAIGLVTNATNSGELYLRDLTLGSTIWVSANARTLDSAETVGNYEMSTNGQFIAYQTTGGNTSGLVMRYNVANGSSDDISTNGAVVTTLDPTTSKIAISADGEFVSYTLTNVYDGESIQLWDSESGLSTLVSGTNVNAYCDTPQVDQTGQYVAFLSDDQFLTPNSDGNFHVYVRDTLSNTVQLVDVVPNGTMPISSIQTAFFFSADGSAIGFDCLDGSLSINPYKSDAFVRSFTSNMTDIISVPAATLPCYTPLNSSQIAAYPISSNGQFVAFTSFCDGIVPGDTNGAPDVYLHNFATGSNTLISVSPFGPYSGNLGSQEGAVSADGRYVAFSSSATNLVTDDTNFSENIFLRDTQAGTTILVSENVTGTGGANGSSSAPQISADGQHVLFSSTANNLTDNTGVPGINFYWRDIKAGATYLIPSDFAVMTPDGSNVLSVVYANNYIGEPGPDMALWNAQTHSVTTVISTGSGLTDPTITEAVISPDAHWAASQTRGIGANPNIYAADLVGNSNWLLGACSPTSQNAFQFSGDSRWLAYVAEFQNTNQIYLYDFQTGNKTLVSQAYNSTNAGNGPSDSPTISADGALLAYRSAATNLVPNDDNGVRDVFLYNRLTGGTTIVSSSSYGAFSANGESLSPVFSADGQTLLFESWASDLAFGDFNESMDVFALSLPADGAASSTNGTPTLSITPLATGVVNGKFSTNQTLTLTWPSVVGVGYQVQYKNDLNDPEWLPLSGTATVVGSQGSIIDLSPSATQRFYRILSY